MQKNFYFSENPTVEGKEDCLYLNVYTPKLRNLKFPLPVMVYIHYGGFTSGTGISSYHAPNYFMNENIVLVTLNYRLGVLGFLSTLDDASPGNWGLKDQVAALQWVQDNISVFGGNNKQVTIFGVSAGGGSVHMHYFSPLTKGLFHRGIAQSGSALAVWARPKDAVQLALTKKQATFMKCTDSDDTQYLVNCLRNVDAFTLVNSSSLFKTFASEPISNFGPVFEKNTTLNPRPYLLEDPLNLLKSGRVHNVPLILGVVSNEGVLRASSLLRPEETRTKLNANFSVLVPSFIAIGASVNPTEVKSVWSKIEDFYLGQNFVDVTDPQSVQGFVNLYSDRLIVYASYQSALLHAWKSNTPTWFYHFNYQGEYSYEPYFANTTDRIDFDWGTGHLDDLLYLFRTRKLFEPLKSYTDKLVSRTMIEMWTSFAKYSDPTPRKDEYSVQWSPIQNLQGLTTVKNNDLTYLDITGTYDKRKIQLKMKNRFYRKRMLFWESLPLHENVAGIE
ncbi:hypothetical protein FQA39_LY05153 [Lamprigera yunnana]|nr:hypothetical protein FQA39_LY05153 [Lamprigera yunnana]